jgi:hypothetical protein
MRLRTAAVGRVAGFTAAVVVILAVSGILSTRRAEDPTRGDLGIPACPASALNALLSPSALQCWFDTSNGRWRILGHESVHGALVVHVEAAQLRDAEAIARRFVDGEGRHSSEILVYVNAESPGHPEVIRRVRWAPGRGYDVLEFATVP